MNGLAELGPCSAGFGYRKDVHRGLRVWGFGNWSRGNVVFKGLLELVTVAVRR